MSTLKITTIERESTLLGGKIVLNDAANANSWQINVLGGTSPNINIGRPGSNPILTIVDTLIQKGILVPNTITVGTVSVTTIGAGITTNGLTCNGTLQINGPSAFTGNVTANNINVGSLSAGNLSVLTSLSLPANSIPISALASTIGVVDSYSNGTNGRIKFSNGFTIQWGSISVNHAAAGGVDSNITFPAPFTAMYGIFTNINAWSASGNATGVASCTDNDTTVGFTLKSYRNVGGVNKVVWAAVGHTA